MAIFSTLRSRRFATQNQASEEQTIAFRLHSEWFAVPILAIQKVIPLGKIYGDPQQTGISLTSYDGQELLVIDVARCIFKRPQSDLIPQNTQDASLESQRYLIVIETEDGNLVGLPTDDTPVILRVDRESLKSLPEAYLKQGNIRCVCSQVIDTQDFPLVFLLDIWQLTQAQFSLISQ
jgi:purine-binding chemotaxis protein CheW